MVITARQWLRCLLVSMLLGALSPYVVVVPLAPAEGERVIDLERFTPQQMQELSKVSPSDWLAAVPMREVHGLERFTYWFTQPEAWSLYAIAALLSFITTFVGTVWVTYLNARAERRLTTRWSGP